MWMKCLKKHFTDRKWRKHYTEIAFCALSVDQGVKPSFLWDIGPSIVPETLSAFIRDLQAQSLISRDIVVITVNGDVLISKTTSLLHSLTQVKIIIHITQSESKWRLCESRKCVDEICDCIRDNIQNESACSDGVINFRLGGDICVPTVFGILLGYPLVYHFEMDYPKTPVRLMLYNVSCMFKFIGSLRKCDAYSFSVPEILWDSHVHGVVDKWYQWVGARGNKNLFCDMEMVSCRVDVMTLNL